MQLQIKQGDVKYSGYVRSFGGGMNRRADSIDLTMQQYALAKNLRARNNSAEPVLSPLQQTKPVNAVNLQGIYAAGNYLVSFFDGKAYYRDVSVSNNFTQVAGFQMNSGVADIFAELIPASSLNYVRKANDGSDNTKGVALGDTVTPAPAAIVCQDGSSQPMFIFQDGTARNCYNAAQWTADNREYVPIGLNMAYSDGVLYIIAPDRLSFYRSVKNRPADFGINVDPAGDLGFGPSGTNLDNAVTTSHAVDYEQITALNKLNITTGALFLANRKQSYIVSPDYTRTIFGEATFINAPLTGTGPLNGFSLAEINGSYAFSDTSGLRAFNAVAQTKLEGQNSPFSKEISPLFEMVDQIDTASTNFDDYALFAVNTIHGPAVIVYDNITGSYVSVDIHPEMSGFIHQFAVVKTSTLQRRIFARTTANEIWELYADSQAETGIYIGDFSTGVPEAYTKPESLYLAFADVRSEGMLTVDAYCDGKKLKTFERSVDQAQADVDPPFDMPYGAAATRSLKTITIKLSDDLPSAWRYGFWITWDFHGSLYSAETKAGSMTADKAPR